jgi:CCR4-NOT transcription complex subunit 7/8
LDHDDPETIRSNDKRSSNVASPRIDSMYHKYYEIIDSKKPQVNSTSIDWKNAKFSSKIDKKNIINNKKIDNILSNTKNSLIFSNMPNNMNNMNHHNNNNFAYTQKNFGKFHINSNIHSNNNMNNHNNNNNNNLTDYNNNKNVKIVSKTTNTTNNNSRKNSIDKSLFKNSKNLFLAVNSKNTLKTSTNSTNNSSSTLLSNNPNKFGYSNNNRDNQHEIDHININLQQHSALATEQSTKKSTKITHHSSNHNKVISEIPVMTSKNLSILKGSSNNNQNMGNIVSTNISKNFLYNNNNLKYYNNHQNSNNINSNSNNNNNNIINNVKSSLSKRKEESLINDKLDRLDKLPNKKTNAFSIPLTSVQSKNHSKNNSKSASRIEEFLDNGNSHNLINPNKQINLQISVAKNSHGYGQGNTNTNNNNNNKIIGKKLVPVTSTNSPKSKMAKDFFNNNNQNSNINTINANNNISNSNNQHKSNHSNITDRMVKVDKKYSMKLNLDMDNLLKNKEKEKEKEVKSTQRQYSLNIDNGLKKKNSLEYILDNSTDSYMSTTRESNYYKREAEKIIQYIKKCKLSQ